MKTMTAKPITDATPELKPLVSAILACVRRPTTWAFALSTMPALAVAQVPTGGQVVAGSAAISAPDANHTLVQQTSDKAVVNWQSFSIGKDAYVQFVQPGSNSVTLNRVVGADPSSILGTLSANGQVFLVNPNGIFFGQSAVVDVAGIVATTLDINNDDFMRGDYQFSRSADAAARGTVVNEGTINANGGYVVLAGDYAANKGVVQAQLGTVLLASGDALTLQTAGSDLITYKVDKATVAQLAGVENSGQILANGGRVIMTADVASDLAATVVNNTGLVQAQGIVERDGAVYFEGLGSGSVVNSGTIDASAQAGANGGHVDIRSGGSITHEAGSQINVSGASTGTSNAGSVYTWADGTNHYKEGASIVARGGAQGGDGGQVELSGNQVLNRSLVDLRAPNGKLGTLTLDPNAITIADGAGADAGDQSTVYEQNLEAQLRTGNVALVANGPDASITVANLSDNVLDGSHNGAGGSLTLTASGSGTPTISFANTANTIKVDGGITLATDDGAGSNAAGAINVGNLEAGTSIALKAGSVTTGNLSVAKSSNSSTDAHYSIDAQAYIGDLTINGNVKVVAKNTTAAGVNSSVSLKSDSGNVLVSGDVTSSATGLGYYHYNWTTAGNNATSYYGQQPWTLVNQGDHAITASLNIQAAGNIAAGNVDVLATDLNTAFSTHIAGSWQTATPTEHNFWRPTAALAASTLTAGGDVSLSGKTTVKADGYAVSDYSEVESWRTMVNNFNYTSANQTVYTDYGCLSMTDGACTGGYGYRSSYIYTDTEMKGSARGDYIWVFGPYTNSLPATSNNSPTRTRTSDSSTNSGSTAMSYSNVRGLSATLDITAGGSVDMNGMDVRSTNRSTTGSSSYTDGNWGRQDTADGLNGTGSSFTSAQREVDYSDTFDTGYTAATSTATANITAGDNGSVTMNDGSSYDVIAEHTGMTGANNYLAGATLNITAGAPNGATGTGVITIGNGINVIGAKDADVSLNIRNHDGDIVTVGAPAVVTNQYSGADGRASIESDNGTVHLDSLAVSGGRAAYLNVSASGDVTIDNASSATAGGQDAQADIQSTNGNVQMDSIAVSGARSAYLDVTAGNKLTIDNESSATVTGTSSVGTAAIHINGAGDVSLGDVLASSTHNLNNVVSSYYDPVLLGTVTDHVVDGGTAAIDVQSVAGNVSLLGDVKASGYKTATVSATANGAGKRLTTAEGKTVSATTSGQTFNSSTYTRYTVPTYSATTSLSASDGLSLGSNVGAFLINRNGTALVDLKTLGGAGASITQGAGSLIKADGSTGTVNVNAGAASPDATNAAGVDMLGAIVGQGSTGAGTVLVNAASGTVSGLGAGSSSNSASVTVNTFDVDGLLTVEGGGSITGNANSGTGALLLVNAAGSLDSSTATIGINNTSTGANAGARADLNAAHGFNKVGSIGVNGFNTAVINATAPGDVTAAGAVSATANAASGRAETTLNSTAGNVAIADTSGSIAARANGNLGVADVKLTGVTGMSLNGNATATALNSGTATLAFTTTGGATASIGQGPNSTLLANGTTSHVKVNAGDATPDSHNSAAFDLQGDVQAVSTSGPATIAVNGQSGAVHTFSAASTGGLATADITALNGALDFTGVGKVSGYDIGTLNASSTGDLSTRDSLSASLSGPLGTAQVNLTSSNGTLLVDTGSAIQAAATGAHGKADLNLTAATGMTVNGNLTSTSAADEATLDLVTTGGPLATLAQGANSTLLATGMQSAITLNAGNAVPDSNNAAALDLQGDLQARSTSGVASIALNGQSGRVQDFSAISTNGQATVGIMALKGALELIGNGTVSGHTGGSLKAVSTGNLTTNGALSVSSSAASGAALANLTSSNGSLTVNDGSAIGTTASGSLGQAGLNLTSANGLTVNGNLKSSAIFGDATLGLMTTGGQLATVSQGAASTILADGGRAAISINAGNAAPDQSNAAELKQAGKLQARSSIGTAVIVVKAASGSLRDFSAESTQNSATVDIASMAPNGTLALNGVGRVTANADSDIGALLKVTSAGALDTTGAELTVSNLSNGTAAGAQVSLLADGGSADLGSTKVTAQGGGIAALIAKAAANITAWRDLAASGLGLGAAAGGAQVSLLTTGSSSAVSTITQTAGTTISAATSGNAGQAAVDMQAGTCCTSAVVLNGTVKSTVDGGTGDAIVGVRGGTVTTVKEVTSEVIGSGTGNALLNIGAPTEIKLAGAINVKAADVTKRADLKLVSDRLTDNATIKLSYGNGHVQLASFDTNRLIGVHSANDFDAVAQTNYGMTTLNKLIGQKAEVTFGGAYDRSAWTKGTPESAWVPGMASWKSQKQQVGDIHVASDGNINLQDVTMVFDTTGTTFYHDPSMSAWSVPSGRVATYVPRPVTNFDRYLDRTDFNSQNLSKIVEQSFDTARATSTVGGVEPVKGAKQIAGNLFMNGDGVNLVKTATVSAEDGAASQGGTDDVGQATGSCAENQQDGQVCSL